MIGDQGVVTHGNKPPTGNIKYPPDNGERSQKHNDSGSTSCWDQTTGKEWRRRLQSKSHASLLWGRQGGGRQAAGKLGSLPAALRPPGGKADDSRSPAGYRADLFSITREPRSVPDIAGTPPQACGSMPLRTSGSLPGRL